MHSSDIDCLRLVVDSESLLSDSASVEYASSLLFGNLGSSNSGAVEAGGASSSSSPAAPGSAALGENTTGGVSDNTTTGTAAAAAGTRRPTGGSGSAATTTSTSAGTPFFDTTTAHGELILTDTTAYKPNVGWVTVHATHGFRSGVHEWGVRIDNQGETNDVSGLMVGVVPRGFTRYDGFVSQGGGWCLSRGGKFYGQWKRIDVNVSQHGIVFGTGDLVSLLLDFDSGRLAVRVGDREVIGELSTTVAPGTELIPAVSLHYRQQHVRFEYLRSYSKRALSAPWRERLLSSTPAVAFDLPPETARTVPFVHPLTTLRPYAPSSSSSSSATGAAAAGSKRGVRGASTAAGGGAAGASGAAAGSQALLPFPGERDCALRLAIVRRACEAARNLWQHAQQQQQQHSFQHQQRVDGSAAAAAVSSSTSSSAVIPTTLRSLWNAQLAVRSAAAATAAGGGGANPRSDLRLAATCGAVVISHTLTLLCRKLQQHHHHRQESSGAAGSNSNLLTISPSKTSAASSSGGAAAASVAASALVQQQLFQLCRSLVQALADPQLQGSLRCDAAPEVVPVSVLDDVVSGLFQFVDSSVISSGGLSSATPAMTPTKQRSSHAAENDAAHDGDEHGKNDGFPPPLVFSPHQQQQQKRTAGEDQKQQQQQQDCASSSHEFPVAASAAFELLLSLSMHRGRVGDVIALVRLLLNAAYAVDDAPLSLPVSSASFQQIESARRAAAAAASSASTGGYSNSKRSQFAACADRLVQALFFGTGTVAAVASLDSAAAGASSGSSGGAAEAAGSTSIASSNNGIGGSSHNESWGAAASQQLRGLSDPVAVFRLRDEALLRSVKKKKSSKDGKETTPAATSTAPTTVKKILSTASDGRYLFVHHDGGLTKVDLSRAASPKGVLCGTAEPAHLVSSGCAWSSCALVEGGSGGAAVAGEEQALVISTDLCVVNDVAFVIYRAADLRVLQTVATEKISGWRPLSRLVQCPDAGCCIVLQYQPVGGNQQQQPALANGSEAAKMLRTHLDHKTGFNPVLVATNGTGAAGANAIARTPSQGASAATDDGDDAAAAAAAAAASSSTAVIQSGGGIGVVLPLLLDVGALSFLPSSNNSSSPSCIKPLRQRVSLSLQQQQQQHQTTEQEGEIEEEAEQKKRLSIFLPPAGDDSSRNSNGAAASLSVLALPNDAILHFALPPTAPSHRAAARQSQMTVEMWLCFTRSGLCEAASSSSTDKVIYQFGDRGGNSGCGEVFLELDIFEGAAYIRGGMRNHQQQQQTASSSNSKNKSRSGTCIGAVLPPHLASPADNARPWFHLALVCDGHLWQLLLDGVVAASAPASAAEVQASAVGELFAPRGSWSCGSPGFGSMMTELRVWQVARSPQEIARDMRTPLSSVLDTSSSSSSSATHATVAALTASSLALYCPMLETGGHAVIDYSRHQQDQQQNQQQQQQLATTTIASRTPKSNSSNSSSSSPSSSTIIAPASLGAALPFCFGWVTRSHRACRTTIPAASYPLRVEAIPTATGSNSSSSSSAVRWVFSAFCSATFTATRREIIATVPCLVDDTTTIFSASPSSVSSPRSGGGGGGGGGGVLADQHGDAVNTFMVSFRLDADGAVNDGGVSYALPGSHLTMCCSVANSTVIGVVPEPRSGGWRFGVHAWGDSSNAATSSSRKGLLRRLWANNKQQRESDKSALIPANSPAAFEHANWSGHTVAAALGLDRSSNDAMILALNLLHAIETQTTSGTIDGAAAFEKVYSPLRYDIRREALEALVSLIRDHFRHRQHAARARSVSGWRSRFSPCVVIVALRLLLRHLKQFASLNVDPAELQLCYENTQSLSGSTSPTKSSSNTEEQQQNRISSSSSSGVATPPPNTAPSAVRATGSKTPPASHIAPSPPPSTSPRSARGPAGKAASAAAAAQQQQQHGTSTAASNLQQAATGGSAPLGNRIFEVLSDVLNSQPAAVADPERLTGTLHRVAEETLRVALPLLFPSQAARRKLLVEALRSAEMEQQQQHAASGSPQQATSSSSSSSSNATQKVLLHCMLLHFGDVSHLALPQSDEDGGDEQQQQQQQQQQQAPPSGGGGAGGGGEASEILSRLLAFFRRIILSQGSSSSNSGTADAATLRETISALSCLQLALVSRCVIAAQQPPHAASAKSSVPIPFGRLDMGLLDIDALVSLGSVARSSSSSSSNPPNETNNGKRTAASQAAVTPFARFVEFLQQLEATASELLEKQRLVAPSSDVESSSDASGSSRSALLARFFASVVFPSVAAVSAVYIAGNPAAAAAAARGSSSSSSSAEIQKLSKSLKFFVSLGEKWTGQMPGKAGAAGNSLQPILPALKREILLVAEEATRAVALLAVREMLRVPPSTTVRLAQQQQQGAALAPSALIPLRLRGGQQSNPVLVRAANGEASIWGSAAQSPAEGAFRAVVAATVHLYSAEASTSSGSTCSSSSSSSSSPPEAATREILLRTASELTAEVKASIGTRCVLPGESTTTAMKRVVTQLHAVFALEIDDPVSESDLVASAAAVSSSQQQQQRPSWRSEFVSSVPQPPSSVNRSVSKIAQTLLRVLSSPVNAGSSLAQWVAASRAADEEVARQAHGLAALADVATGAPFSSSGSPPRLMCLALWCRVAPLLERRVAAAASSSTAFVAVTKANAEAKAAAEQKLLESAVEVCWGFSSSSSSTGAAMASTGSSNDLMGYSSCSSAPTSPTSSPSSAAATAAAYSPDACRYLMLIVLEHLVAHAKFARLISADVPRRIVELLTVNELPSATQMGSSSSGGGGSGQALDSSSVFLDSPRVKERRQVRRDRRTRRHREISVFPEAFDEDLFSRETLREETAARAWLVLRRLCTRAVDAVVSAKSGSDPSSSSSSSSSSGTTTQQQQHQQQVPPPASGTSWLGFGLLWSVASVLEHEVEAALAVTQLEFSEAVAEHLEAIMVLLSLMLQSVPAPTSKSYGCRVLSLCQPLLRLLCKLSGKLLHKPSSLATLTCAGSALNISEVVLHLLRHACLRLDLDALDSTMAETPGMGGLITRTPAAAAAAASSALDSITVSSTLAAAGGTSAVLASAFSAAGVSSPFLRLVLDVAVGGSHVSSHDAVCSAAAAAARRLLTAAVVHAPARSSLAQKLAAALRAVIEYASCKINEESHAPRLDAAYSLWTAVCAIFGPQAELPRVGDIVRRTKAPASMVALPPSSALAGAGDRSASTSAVRVTHVVVADIAPVTAPSAAALRSSAGMTGSGAVGGAAAAAAGAPGAAGDSMTLVVPVEAVAAVPSAASSSLVNSTPVSVRSDALLSVGPRLPSSGVPSTVQSALFYCIVDAASLLCRTPVGMSSNTAAATAAAAAASSSSSAVCGTGSSGIGGAGSWSSNASRVAVTSWISSSAALAIRALAVLASSPSVVSERLVSAPAQQWNDTRIKLRALYEAVCTRRVPDGAPLWAVEEHFAVLQSCLVFSPAFRTSLLLDSTLPPVPSARSPVSATAAGDSTTASSSSSCRYSGDVLSALAKSMPPEAIVFSRCNSVVASSVSGCAIAAGAGGTTAGGFASSQGIPGANHLVFRHPGAGIHCVPNPATMAAANGSSAAVAAGASRRAGTSPTSNTSGNMPSPSNSSSSGTLQLSPTSSLTVELVICVPDASKLAIGTAASQHSTRSSSAYNSITSGGNSASSLLSAEAPFPLVTIADDESGSNVFLSIALEGARSICISRSVAVAPAPTTATAMANHRLQRGNDRDDDADDDDGDQIEIDGISGSKRELALLGASFDNARNSSSSNNNNNNTAPAPPSATKLSLQLDQRELGRWMRLAVVYDANVDALLAYGDGLLLGTTSLCAKTISNRSPQSMRPVPVSVDCGGIVQQNDGSSTSRRVSSPSVHEIDPDFYVSLAGMRIWSQSISGHKLKFAGDDIFAEKPLVVFRFAEGTGYSTSSETAPFVPTHLVGELRGAVFWAPTELKAFAQESDLRSPEETWLQTAGTASPEAESGSDGAGNCAVRKEWLGRGMVCDATSLGTQLTNLAATMCGHYARSAILQLFGSLTSPILPIWTEHQRRHQQQQQSSSSSSSSSLVLELLAALSPERSSLLHNAEAADSSSDPPSQVVLRNAHALAALSSVGVNLARYVAHKETDGVVARCDDSPATSVVMAASGSPQQQQQQQASTSSSPCAGSRPVSSLLRRCPLEIIEDVTRAALSGTMNLVAASQQQQQQSLHPLIVSMLHDTMNDIIEAAAPEFEARTLDVSASNVLGGGAAGGPASAPSSPSGGDTWIVPVIVAGQASGSFVLSLEGATHLDQLQIFHDRALRSQLAKFPDSQGAWSEVEYPCGSWFFVKPGTTASPSQLGSAHHHHHLSAAGMAKAIVKSRSQRSLVALRMLDAAMNIATGAAGAAAATTPPPPAAGTAVLVRSLCCAPVLVSLLSLCHAETGQYRALFSKALVSLLRLWSSSPAACATSPHDRVPLGLLLERMTVAAASLFRKEEMSAALAGSTAPRMVQNVMELCATAIQTEETWFRKLDISLPKNSNSVTAPSSSTFSLLETERRHWTLAARHYVAGSMSWKHGNGASHLPPPSHASPAMYSNPTMEHLRAFFDKQGGDSGASTNSSSSGSGNEATVPCVDLEPVPSAASSAAISASALLQVNLKRRRRGIISCASERGVGCFRSTAGYSSGQWFFEVRIPQSFSSVAIAVVLSTFRLPANFSFDSPSSLGISQPFGQADGGQSWCFDGSRLCRWHNGVRADFAYRAKWKARDVIGIVLDLDNGTLGCLHNGKSSGTGFENLKSCAANAAAMQGGSNTPVYFHAAVSFAQGGCEVNFGGAPFVFGPGQAAAPDLYGGSLSSVSSTGFLPFDPVALRRSSHLPPVIPIYALSQLTKDMAGLQQKETKQKQQQQQQIATGAAKAADDGSSSSSSSSTFDWLLRCCWNSAVSATPPSSSSSSSSSAASSGKINNIIFAEGRHGDEEVSIVVLEGKARLDSELLSLSLPHLGCARSTTTVCTLAGHIRINAPKGKFYYEVHIQGEGVILLGWAAHGFSPDSARSRSIGDDALSWGVDGCRMLARHNRQQRSLGRHPWREGDVVGTLLDCEAGSITFYVNGVPLRDVSDPLPSAADGGAAASSSQPPLFTRVPVQSGGGLFPVVTVEPDALVSLSFNRDELVYCPADAMPLGRGDELPRMLETRFGSGGQDSSSSGGGNSLSAASRTASGRSNINSMMPPTLLQPSFIRRVADRLGAATDPDFGRPVHWRKACDDVSAEMSQPVEVVRTIALFLMRVTRLAMCAQRYAAFDTDCQTLSASSSTRGVGALQRALDVVRPFVLSSGASMLLQPYFRRTNGHGETNKLSLSRRRAMAPPVTSRLVDSILGQVYQLLQDKPSSLFITGRRLWSVQFVGEGADDAGGPYRESVGAICAELQQQQLQDGDSASGGGGGGLILIPSPNQQHGLGEIRDRFVFDPAAFRAAREVLLPLTFFVGQIVGGCLRSGDLLSLSLPSTLWKALVGQQQQPLDFDEDMPAIDAGLVSSMQYMISASAQHQHQQQQQQQQQQDELDDDVYDGNFVAVDSSGQEVSLFPGGEDIEVKTMPAFALFLKLWRTLRLKDESAEAVAVFCRGFHTVVPPSAVRALRWCQLERAVCGRADFSVDEMEAMARYEGLARTDTRVVWFWQTLRSWQPADRALFARFISGRERLSTVPKLKLLPAVPPEGCASEDELLPHASTCFIWLSLPSYSSAAVLSQKLLYAVRHCVDIDADFRVRDVENDAEQGPRLLRARPSDDNEFEDYSHLL